MAVQALAIVPEPGALQRVTCGQCDAAFAVRGPKRKQPEAALRARGASVASPGRPLIAHPAAPARAAGARWQVRKSDGTTLQFPSLRLFQKWVADGVVSLDDQISRNGNEWRPITLIPELVGLFEQVRKAQPQPALPPGFTVAGDQVAAPPALPDPSEPSLEPAPPLPEPEPQIDASPPLPEPEPQVDPGPPLPEPEPVVDPAPPLPEPAPVVDPAPTSPEPAPLVEPPKDESAPVDVAASESAPSAEWTALAGAEDADGATFRDMPSPAAEELPGWASVADSVAPVEDDPAGWSPSFSDLSAFAEDIPAGQAPVVDSGSDPDAVGTHPDMAIPADRKLSELEEMDLAGSTLEMRLPDSNFELGRAIEEELADTRDTSPEKLPVPAHDPFAVTVPEFQLPTGDAPPPAVALEAPVNAAGAGPKLDLEHHIQPVQAVKTLKAPREVPLTSDETGKLGHPGWLKALLILTSFATLGVVGFAMWEYTKRQPLPDMRQFLVLADAPPTRAPPGEPGPIGTDEPEPTGPITPHTDNAVATAAGSNELRAPELEQRAAGPDGQIRQPLAITHEKGKKPKDEKAKKPKDEKAKKPKDEKGKKPKDEKGRKPKDEKGKKPKDEKGKKPKDEKPKDEKGKKPKDEDGKVQPAGTYDGIMKQAALAMKRRKPKQALALYRQAAKMNSVSAEPLAKMGQAYLRMGNATQAILKFQEAKQKNPGYRSTYIGLGRAMEQAGRVGDAIVVYRQYLRMCPNCRRAKRVRANLMRLGAAP